MATIEENSKMSPEKVLDAIRHSSAGTKVGIGDNDPYYSGIDRDQLKEMITWTKHTKRDFEVFQEKRQKRRDRRDICSTTITLWFCMFGLILGIVTGYLVNKLNSLEGWLAYAIFPIGVVLYWQYIRHNYKVNGDLLD